MSEQLTLVFEVHARDHRLTTYTVHAGGLPSGTLTQPNAAFDIIVDSLARNLDPDITFNAVHYHPEHGWPIRYRNGFWACDCDDHPDEVLADRELRRAAAMVADHVEEHHQ